mgnify:CR=1 FL=1
MTQLVLRLFPIFPILSPTNTALVGLVGSGLLAFIPRKYALFFKEDTVGKRWYMAHAGMVRYGGCA